MADERKCGIVSGHWFSTFPKERHMILYFCTIFNSKTYILVYFFAKARFQEQFLYLSFEKDTFVPNHKMTKMIFFHQNTVKSTSFGSEVIKYLLKH